MAKHRKARRAAAAPLFFAGATAALSSALALGHATNATAATIPTADTVIGVGGWKDPAGDRIPNKFEGKLVQPGQTYVGVRYPAQLPVDPSVAAGQKPLADAVEAADGTVLIVGYSEGSLVAERYKRTLTPAEAQNVDFLFIAAPFVPNGGIYSRFSNLRIPGFTSTGAATPSPADETFVTLEYDLIGDFPAYANPLSLANAVLGLVYVHGDQGPDNVDLETAPKAVKVVTTEAGGTDTYILVRAEHLPLLQPIRDVAAATGTTAVVEPFVGAVEPTVRLLVDMGYTDRDYRNADKPTGFSLITPPDRIVQTVSALPDAVREGAQNFSDALPSAPKPAPKKATQKVTQTTPELAEDAGADHAEAGAGKSTVRRGSPVHRVLEGFAPKCKTGAKSEPETEAATESEPSHQQTHAAGSDKGTDTDTDKKDTKDEPAA